MRVLETIGKREGLTKKSLCNIIDFTKLVELNQSVRDNTSFEKYRSLGYDHEKLFMSYKDYLNEFLPETAHLVDGNMGTCKHVKEILEQKHELNEENHVGKIEIYNSSEDQKYMTLSNKLLAR